MTLEQYHQRRSLMIRYLELKVAEADWHGVADAAMDLRELEVEKTHIMTSGQTTV